MTTATGKVCSFLAHIDMNLVTQGINEHQTAKLIPVQASPYKPYKCVGDATFYALRQEYQKHYYRRFRMGFRRVRKIATSDYYFHHVCPQFGRPSVSPHGIRSHWTDFHEFNI